jgi:hypothetical protein
MWLVKSAYVRDGQHHGYALHVVPVLAPRALAAAHGDGSS